MRSTLRLPFSAKCGVNRGPIHPRCRQHRAIGLASGPSNRSEPSSPLGALGCLDVTSTRASHGKKTRGVRWAANVPPGLYLYSYHAESGLQPMRVGVETHACVRGSRLRHVAASREPHRAARRRAAPRGTHSRSSHSARRTNAGAKARVAAVARGLGLRRRCGSSPRAKQMEDDYPDDWRDDC